MKHRFSKAHSQRESSSKEDTQKNAQSGVNSSVSRSCNFQLKQHKPATRAALAAAGKDLALLSHTYQRSRADTLPVSMLMRRSLVALERLDTVSVTLMSLLGGKLPAMDDLCGPPGTARLLTHRGPMLPTSPLQPVDKSFAVEWSPCSRQAANNPGGSSETHSNGLPQFPGIQAPPLFANSSTESFEKASTRNTSSMANDVSKGSVVPSLSLNRVQQSLLVVSSPHKSLDQGGTSDYIPSSPSLEGSLLQPEVRRRVEQLLRVLAQLGEDPREFPPLRFPPGALLAELDAVIMIKEKELAAVKKDKNGNVESALCENFLRGTCTRGVTCSDNHSTEALNSFMAALLQEMLETEWEDDDEVEPLKLQFQHLVATRIARINGRPPPPPPVASRHASKRASAARHSVSQLETARGDNDLSFNNSINTMQGRHSGVDNMLAVPEISLQDALSDPDLTVKHPAVATLRERIGPEASEAFFRQLVEINFPFCSLVLRNASRSLLKCLIRELRHNALPFIEHIDISRGRLGKQFPQGILKLARALVVNETVTSLSLGFNNLGSSGVLVILQALAGRLRGHNDDLSAVAAAAATGDEPPMAGDDGNPGVLSIDFGYNGIRVDESAFEHLCRLLQIGDLSGLQRLGLAGNPLGPEGGRTLVQALAANPYLTLTNLDLSRTGLGDRGCAALAHFLAAPADNSDGEEDGESNSAKALQRSSTRNCFSGNIFGKGMNEPCFVVTHSASALQVLNLGWNNITFEGISLLSQALIHNNVLTVLRLPFNPGIGRKGAIALANILKQGNALPLHTLDIRWTFPTDDGIASIAEAVSHNRYIRRVHLFGNDLDPRSEAMLREKLLRRDETGALSKSAENDSLIFGDNVEDSDSDLDPDLEII